MIQYTFSNTEFEDAIAIQLDGLWQGVSSLQFNDSPPLVGDLTWLEGYQFKILVKDSTITLGANKNYGVPVDCETFFDIENDCDKLISYINGVTVSISPGKFSLLAGQNIVLYDDPTNHRIYVGLNFDTTSGVCTNPLPNPSPNTQ